MSDERFRCGQGSGSVAPFAFSGATLAGKLERSGGG